MKKGLGGGLCPRAAVRSQLFNMRAVLKLQAGFLQVRCQEEVFSSLSSLSPGFVFQCLALSPRSHNFLPQKILLLRSVVQSPRTLILDI